MSRWHPMASIVTIAPSIANISKSLGIAMISLDFSVTFTWPRTRRLLAAKAETMWIWALPPFLLPERRTALPSIAITPAGTPVTAAPGDEAALKLLGIKGGEDIADAIMRRGPTKEGAESAQKRQLFFTEARDIGECISPGQHRQQRQKQHFVEWVDHLHSLARIRQVVEIT